MSRWKRMAAGVAMTAVVLGTGFAMGEPAAHAVPPPNPPKHCDAGTDGAGCVPTEGGSGDAGDGIFVNYLLDGTVDWDGWSWGVFYRSDRAAPTWLDVINLRAEEPGFVKCTLSYQENAKDADGIFCR